MFLKSKQITLSAVCSALFIFSTETLKTLIIPSLKMFKRIFTFVKNNKTKTLLLTFTGSHLISLPILTNSHGDITPVLHRKRFILEDEETEQQIIPKVIKKLQKSKKLYHSPQIDTPFNHIMNVGVPKLLNAYRNEVGDEKFQSLEEFVKKVKWEVFVVENGGPVVKSLVGKTFVGDSYIKGFNDEDMKFFLCREVGRSVCRHEDEMVTYLTFAIVDLVLAGVLAFLFLSRIAATRFSLAGGAVVLLFDIYKSRRLEYEADCVGQKLYEFCGWHPEAGQDSENALEWFKTHPNSYSLVSNIARRAAYQRPDNKDSASQRTDSTEL